jgi:hypothetical protein
MEKRLPLGIEDYKTVSIDCYYVDKTLLIKDMVDMPTGAAVLFTRPRRFGKSLALSMLEAFFERGEDNRKYFEGKAILSADSHYLDCLGRFPVIRLVMKNVQGADYPHLVEKLKSAIEKEYRRHEEILKGDCLNGKDKAYFSAIENGTASEEDYSSSLERLSYFLSVSYQEKVVILIDEYDSPIEEGRENGYYQQAIALFRSFYGEALKSNSAVKIAVLSGVMQVAKESLFSGLNNLVVDNITTPRFSECFGFTEQETKDILAYYHHPDDFSKVKEWYGGYRFGGKSIINPWSVLSFLYQGVYDTYWTNTGKNSLIGDILMKASPSVLSVLSGFLSGENSLHKINTAVDYGDLSSSTDTLVSFLAAAGYLGLKEKVDDLMYQVGIPNREVKEGFAREIKERCVAPESISGFYSLKTAFLSGNEEDVSKALESVLLSSFSYFDFGDEKNYQVMVLALAALLFDNCLVKSEVNTGTRRCDILLSPRNEHQLGAVIEIKRQANRSSLGKMKDASLAAIKQIKKNDYVEELRNRKASPIYLYGIVFHNKKAVVSVEKC